MRALCVLVCTLALFAYGCADGESIPAQLESGFDFRKDAFAFENFAGAEATGGLSPDLVARMCGKKLACENNALPCRASDIALGWAEQVNSSLSEGRSEGFAVLSQLLSLGELDPKDFGAKTTAELSLSGNAYLNAELAYWAATQAVPSALKSDERHDAKSVMGFLTKIFRKSDSERWRMAIAIATERGFERGHALVPIGFYRTDQDVYALRVYDSNFPLSERTLEIDVASNTWRYAMDFGGETLVYEGTADNGNQMYFSRVNDRLGELACPIDPDTEVVTASTSGKLSALASAGAKVRAGFADDGRVVEEGGARITPAFAACPLCKASSGTLNFVLPSDGKQALSLVVSGGVGMSSSSADGTGAIHVTQGNTTTKVTGISGDATKKDQLTIGTDGTTTYEGETGSDVTLSQAVKGDDGVTRTVSVQVTLPDGKTRTTRLTIGTDGKGRPTVDTTGLPDGATLNIAFQKDDGSAEQTTTVEVKGGSPAFTIDPDSGEIFDESARCNNGKFDQGFEVAKDCGDTCAAGCPVGTPCTSHADCDQGVETPDFGEISCLGDEGEQTCQPSGCSDGLKNNDEANVDCGDLRFRCQRCESTNDLDAPYCFAGDNCSSGVCGIVEGDYGCRTQNEVYVDIQGLAASAKIGFETELDSANWVSHTFDAGPSAQRFSLGKAFHYRTRIVQQPPGKYCGFGTSASDRKDIFFGDTGYPADAETGYERVVPVFCTSSARTGNLVVSGLPSGQVVKVTARTTLNDYQLLSVSQDGTTSVTIDYSRYYFAVDEQPGQATVAGVKQYTRCLFPDDSTSVGGTLAPASTIEATLTCTSESCATSPYCSPDVYAALTGLPAGSEVDVTFTGTGAAKDLTLSQDGTTLLASESASYSLSVTQPAEIGSPGSQSAVECLWDESSSATLSASAPTADVTHNLTCSTYPCPDARCTGSLFVNAAGLPTGVSASVQASYAGSAASANYSNGSTEVGEAKSDYTLVVTQPGKMMVGQSEVYVQCFWDNATDTKTGSVGSDDVTETLTCTQYTCPHALCTTTCTLDSDCSTGSDCECGASSGNCTGNTGKCGAGKGVFDIPTTDGVAASGTFNVPTGCDQVYVEAWGAAGGSGLQEDPFFGPMAGFGGAGGYVSGTLSVSPGDVFTVWVGQGGGTDGGDGVGLGSSGIGSNLGTLASGGKGDVDLFVAGDGTGGDGGGLTSVRLTGSLNTSFLVGAGGGGAVGGMGDYVGSGFGTTVVTAAGGDASVDTFGGGGGAGELGGEGAVNYQAGGSAGTNSASLPSGLSETAASTTTPAGTSNPDYGNLCRGLSAGSVGAGASGNPLDFGGDGCVVIRCKGL